MQKTKKSFLSTTGRSCLFNMCLHVLEKEKRDSSPKRMGQKSTKSWSRQVFICTCYFFFSLVFPFLCWSLHIFISCAVLRGGCLACVYVQQGRASASKSVNRALPFSPLSFFITLLAHRNLPYTNYTYPPPLLPPSPRPPSPTPRFFSTCLLSSSPPPSPFSRFFCLAA